MKLGHRFLNGCCEVLTPSSHTQILLNSTLVFADHFLWFYFKIVYFFLVSNHTVKRIGDDSYFILKLTILKTSTASHRLGHVRRYIYAEISSFEDFHNCFGWKIWTKTLHLEVNLSNQTQKAAKRTKKKQLSSIVALIM